MESITDGNKFEMSLDDNITHARKSGDSDMRGQRRGGRGGGRGGGQRRGGGGFGGGFRNN